MTTTAVATRPTAAKPTNSYELMTFPQRIEYANLLAGARGLIPNGLQGNTAQETAARIFLVCETGAMLGLHPMAAMQGIDVIEGRATISPQMMTGLLRSHGFTVRYERKGSIAGGDFSCTATLIRPGDEERPENWFTSTWTIQKAIAAGLVDSYRQNGTSGPWVVLATKGSKGNASNWQKYPENMCQWRATGDVGRAGGDDVLLGIGYTPEEMNAVVDDQGTIAAPDPDREAEYAQRMLACTDKEEIRKIYREAHRADYPWTDKLQATLAEALAQCVTDSNPKPGAPGNTGDAALDQKAIAANTPEHSEAEPPADDEQQDEGFTPDAAPTPQTSAEQRGEMSPEEYEAWSAAEADRIFAEQERERAQERTAAAETLPRVFKGDALEGLGE